MIYLDNSATTRVTEATASIASKYMTDIFFNPASAYIPSVAVERDIKAARSRLAGAYSCTADELIFTSGGTESNNTAILGSIRSTRSKGRVICTSIEHPSVYEVFSFLKELGYDVQYAPVTKIGSVDYDRLFELVTPDTLFVSIMHVNNETGAINDLAYCRNGIKSIAPNAVFHSDGVQAFCKLPFAKLPCDMYSISGHKVHAPKGVGALYVKKGTRFSGGLFGGGQENGLRSGTTNAPGIMAFDAAVTHYRENQSAYIDSMYTCKLKLAQNLSTLPDVIFNGPTPREGAPHILNASFLGVRGEVLLHSLAEQEIYVSTGSACSTHKKGNRILEAMGITGDRKEGAIRFSLCPYTTVSEVDRASEAISTIISKLRKYKRK